MFTFGIIPTSGVPSASTTVAAWSPLRIQGETQAEACQGCVFAIDQTLMTLIQTVMTLIQTLMTLR